MKDKILVDHAIRDFLISCKADGLSPNTVAWYRGMLHRFASHFRGMALQDIRPALVREFVVSLQEQKTRFAGAPQRPEVPGGLSRDTIRDHMRALKRLWNWSIMEYDLDPAINPMNKIRIPGRNRTEPKAVALEDIKRLLVACDPETPIGRRDRAIIAFLTDTGCRAAGLLTLKRSDLYLERGYAVVNEKGDKQRAVPFTPYTAGLLRAWLEVSPNCPTVFCSLQARRMGQPLSLSGLAIRLKELKRLAGVTGRVNPHSFRHGFARQYLANHGDLATLAALMGHSNVAVTASFYAVYSDLELQKFHAQFSPMRNIKESRNDE